MQATDIMDDFLRLNAPDDTDFQFQMAAMRREIKALKEQMRQEQREHRRVQQYLAEIAKEKANLGPAYRVNWLKEGF